MILLDDKTCPVGMIGNLMRFLLMSLVVSVRLVGWIALGGGDTYEFCKGRVPEKI